MSSSISSSDAIGADGSAWERWLTAFVGAIVLGSALVFALVLIVDPYDSGRFGLLAEKFVSQAFCPLEAFLGEDH